MDWTSKYILDPRLFQPRIDAPSSSISPQETSNAISPTLLPHPMPYNNDIEQSNDSIRLANGNSDQGNVAQSNISPSVVSQSNISPSVIAQSNVKPSIVAQSNIGCSNVSQ